VNGLKRTGMLAVGLLPLFAAVAAQANQTIVLAGSSAAPSQDSASDATQRLVVLTPQLIGTQGSDAKRTAPPRPLAVPPQRIRPATAVTQQQQPAILQQILHETRRLREDINQLRRQINGLRESLEAEQSQAGMMDEQPHKSNTQKLSFEELVAQYNTLMKQKRYFEAETTAEKARQLEPDNPGVEAMVWKSRFARRIVEPQFDSVLRVFRGQSHLMATAKTVQRIAVADFSVIDVMQFSPHEVSIIGKQVGSTTLTVWLENEHKPVICLVSVLPEPCVDGIQPVNDAWTEDEAKIDRKLNDTISLHFENEPLGKVMEHIATAADVNIAVDKLGLEEEGLTPQTPVSIALADVKLRNALHLILEPLRLSYVIGHGALTVTGARRAQGPLTTVVYPVADLVESPLSATKKPLNLDTLSQLIETTVNANSWCSVGGNGRIQPGEAKASLVISQTKQTHEAIQKLLEDLRRTRKPSDE